jgi:predicted DNA-binding protein (MmcQ/YjbR family)
MALMADRRQYSDVPDDVVARLRPICAELPDAYEEPAWVGTRWRVRKRTFAHVLSIQDSPATPPVVALTFRSSGPELEMLTNAGHPYFYAGWGRDVVGMVLDDHTDWTEVAELLTESYCVMAPKKLAALVDRPEG